MVRASPSRRVPAARRANVSASTRRLLNDGKLVTREKGDALRRADARAPVARRRARTAPVAVRSSFLAAAPGSPGKQAEVHVHHPEIRALVEDVGPADASSDIG